MPLLDSYDYVIVGGGSAGCAAAYRLATRGMSEILLIEAGGAGDQSDVTDPTRWPMLFGSDADWAYETVPQEATGGRAHQWSQGRLLGGGSATNSMVYMRGAPWDFDEWASHGNLSWDYRSVLQVFRAMEDFDGGDPEYRGRGGPLRLSVADHLNPITEAFLAACGQVGYREAVDFNGADAEGFAPHQLNLVDGVRQSARVAFLDRVRGQDNVTVLTGALAHSLRLNAAGRALSVDVTVHGQKVRIGIGKHLVVSAGAIGSPKLLMLSGIGPATELSRWGIRVVIDLPGVGRNLHDHLALPVTWEATQPIPLGRNQLSEASLFCRSSPSSPRYDLQFVCPHMPIVPKGYTCASNGYSIVSGLLNPTSRGNVTLRSADPIAPPVIDPAYLRDTVDVERLARSVEISREIGYASAFDAWRGREVSPTATAISTPAAALNYVAKAARTYYHPVGTCRMGQDQDSVVDHRLLVHGTENIYVADNSIMPSIVSANTNAAAMMIGWRVADFVSRPRRSTLPRSTPAGEGA